MFEARVGNSHHRIRLIENAANMPELMAEADLAVSGAGSTAWEFAFMGVPALLIAIAGNQEPIARRLERHGVAVNLGRSDEADASDVSTPLRSIVSDRDRRLARPPPWRLQGPPPSVQSVHPAP